MAWIQARSVRARRWAIRAVWRGALDEALDEDLVGDAFGLEVVEDGLAEFVVVGGAFAGEDDGFGGEAVFEGVESGFGFAFGGAGSGGFLGIAAVGRDLACGGHVWVPPFLGWQLGANSVGFAGGGLGGKWFGWLGLGFF